MRLMGDIDRGVTPSPVAMKESAMYKQHMTGVVFSLIWSSAFIAGKVAMHDLDSVVVLFIRFVFCSLLLVPFYKPKASSSLRLSQGSLAVTGMALGVLNNVIYLGMTFYALNFITPEWVIIIVSCSPFVTSGLSAVIGKEKLSVRKIIGFIIGFCGVLIMTGITGLGAEAVWGLLLAFGGMFSFSLGTVIFREKGQGIPLQTNNFWMSLAAVPLFGLWIWGKGIMIPSISFAAWAAIGWLVVVTLLGMALWLYLIRCYGAITAAGYHLLNPVSGLVLAFLVLGNVPQWYSLLGAITTCAGLYIASPPVKTMGSDS